MTIDRDALAETLGAVSLIRERGETRDFGHRLADAVLDAILPEVQAQTLEDAADNYSDWETFVAADGITSTRMHGKDPDDWMRDRAANLRKAASE